LFIWFIWLVSFNQKPNKRDKPNKPNNGLLLLADFFSILPPYPHKDTLVSKPHHGMLRGNGWFPHTAPIP
jgi:hypothetical protein